MKQVQDTRNTSGDGGIYRFTKQNLSITKLKLKDFKVDFINKFLK